MPAGFGRIIVDVWRHLKQAFSHWTSQKICEPQASSDVHIYQIQSTTWFTETVQINDSTIYRTWMDGKLTHVIQVEIKTVKRNKHREVYNQEWTFTPTDPKQIRTHSNCHLHILIHDYKCAVLYCQAFISCWYITRGCFIGVTFADKCINSQQKCLYFCTLLQHNVV